VYFLGTMTKLNELERTLKPTHFECSTHSSLLLGGLQGLRRQGLLIDVTLHVEGESFYAHKAVLAACSDYFRAMFTDAMKVLQKILYLFTLFHNRCMNMAVLPFCDMTLVK